MEAGDDGYGSDSEDFDAPGSDESGKADEVPTWEERRQFQPEAVFGVEACKRLAAWPRTLLEDLARARCLWDVPSDRGPGKYAEVDTSPYSIYDLIPLRHVVHAWFLVLGAVLVGSIPRLSMFDGPWDNDKDETYYREPAPPLEAPCQLSRLEWFPDPPLAEAWGGQLQGLRAIQEAVQAFLPRVRSELLAHDRPELLLVMQIRGRELPLEVALYGADPERPTPVGTSLEKEAALRQVAERGTLLFRPRRDRRRSRAIDAHDCLERAFELSTTAPLVEDIQSFIGGIGGAQAGPGGARGDGDGDGAAQYGGAWADLSASDSDGGQGAIPAAC